MGTGELMINKGTEYTVEVNSCSWEDRKYSRGELIITGGGRIYMDG